MCNLLSIVSLNTVIQNNWQQYLEGGNWWNPKCRTPLTSSFMYGLWCLIKRPLSEVQKIFAINGSGKLRRKPNWASVEPLFTTRLRTGFFTCYLKERLRFREEVALRNKCQERSLHFPRTILVLERGVSPILYLYLLMTSPVILGQF